MTRTVLVGAMDAVGSALMHLSDAVTWPFTDYDYSADYDQNYRLQNAAFYGVNPNSTLYRVGHMEKWGQSPFY